MLYHKDDFIEIHHGHALEVIKELPNESVQCVITSPPYWGLRNYAGGADIVWGKNNCDHQWLEDTQGLQHENWNNLIGSQEDVRGKSGTTFIQKYDRLPSGVCTKCGAWHGQLGLEPTPELYAEHLMMIFREVKRVLRKDGSFYLNIGDTYVSGKGSCFNPGGGPKSWQSWNDRKANYPTGRDAPNRMCKTIPAKCMACIPERVLFAMLDDGWILRNKLIWHKPNSMPSSVKDRFTQTWEYLYFFVKNSTPCLWRNRETGEWRDSRPTKEENYPQGGMYYYPESNSYGWQKMKGCKKVVPLWMAYNYYFDLDAVRIPHKAQSLEKYQRGVNLGRPAEGKSGVVGPMQQYIRAPGWFQEIFPPDKDYSGKFNGLFGHGPSAQSFNLRVRDVKRGKKGTSAQSGELKAAEQEIEAYEYPEKHHGSSMSNQLRLHRDREQKHEDADLGAQKPARTKHSGYFDKEGKPLVDFAKGKNPGDILTPRQEEIISHFEEKGSGGHYLYGGLESPEGVHQHPKGKNPGDTMADPGDFWELTTQPSSIAVCPSCLSVFPKLIKICPKCGAEGITGHFAPFPEKLCITPILASTRAGDVVVDPFAGTGTVGVVAKKLGRKAILIDCVKTYCAMSKYRTSKVVCQPEIKLT